MPSDHTRLQLQTEDALVPEMTYQEFMYYIAESDLTKENKLKLYNKVGDLLIQKIFLMIFDGRDRHQIIHMGTSPDSFVLAKSKLARRFNPFEPKTMEFEIMPNMELSLFKQKDEYNRITFDTWDGDFLAKTFDMNYLFKNKKNPVYYSLEMYLLSYMYIYNKSYKKSGKTSTYHLEDLAANSKIMGNFKKTNNILYHGIPKMLKIINTNTHYQKRYKQFEKKLMAMVRILSDKTPKEQYKILEAKSKLRQFVDVIKTRSHLPTIYGMYIMNICEALNISQKNIRYYIRNPTKAPMSLKSMLNYYWLQMLLPFDEIHYI